VSIGNGEENGLRLGRIVQRNGGRASTISTDKPTPQDDLPSAEQSN
jgi:hypothetical protein